MVRYFFTPDKDVLGLKCSKITPHAAKALLIPLPKSASGGEGGY
jgi:hypothetical protein